MSDSQATRKSREVCHSILFRIYGVVLAALVGCAANSGLHKAESYSPCSDGTGKSVSRLPPAGSMHDVNKLLTVDCMLPGQTIKIGRYQTWQAPPRPAKVSAWECEAQGGQYVAFDRANRDTALNVWRRCAEEGDKVAENYMGEIYERGWGVTPDYIQAAKWYEKSAAQGYARAETNLAFLYEKGLGVKKDLDKASTLRGEVLAGVGSKIPTASHGNYHALIIGNNDYQFFPKLKTAVNDAESISGILSGKFGFVTEKLVNVTVNDVMLAISRLRTKVSERDSLLIYFAGHGQLLGSRANWLQVDAKPDIPGGTGWLPTQNITSLVEVPGLRARDVRIIADSCYAGAAELDSGSTMRAKDAGNSVRKSRVVMTSGGVEPVIDSGGDGHSVFANVLLSTLKSVDKPKTAMELYSDIKRQMEQRSIQQVPGYNPIRFAGDESADFMFRKKTNKFKDCVDRANLAIRSSK